MKTLFLDRDGVINIRIDDNYVKSTEDFVFIDGVIQAMKILKEKFNRIIIVSNQQGIGKGLMTHNDLKKIHEKMRNEIESAGGKIDEIFYCPDLKTSNSFFRKPNIGMGLKAKKYFPEINFKQSIMVGDSKTDLIFANRLGMTSVLISPIPIKSTYPKIDMVYNNLLEFAQQCEL